MQKKNWGGGGRGGLVGGVRVDVNEELVFVKIQKKNNWVGVGGGGGGGGGGWLGGQGGCERRIKNFVKIKKKNIFFFEGGGGGRGSVWGGGVGLVGWVG